MTTVTELLNTDRTSLIDRADSLETLSETLDAMAAMASEHPETSVKDPGFFDMALFYARKYASNENELVRNSVVSVLLKIGTINGNWREAVVETVEEIEMQPSRLSLDVALKTRRALEQETPSSPKKHGSE